MSEFRENIFKASSICCQQLLFWHSKFESLIFSISCKEFFKFGKEGLECLERIRRHSLLLLKDDDEIFNVLTPYVINHPMSIFQKLECAFDSLIRVNEETTYESMKGIVCLFTKACIDVRDLVLICEKHIHTVFNKNCEDSELYLEYSSMFKEIYRNFLVISDDAFVLFIDKINISFSKTIYQFKESVRSDLHMIHNILCDAFFYGRISRVFYSIGCIFNSKFNDLIVVDKKKCYMADFCFYYFSLDHQRLVLMMNRVSQLLDCSLKVLGLFLNDNYLNNFFILARYREIEYPREFFDFIIELGRILSPLNEEIKEHKLDGFLKCLKDGISKTVDEAISECLYNIDDIHNREIYAMERYRHIKLELICDFFHDENNVKNAGKSIIFNQCFNLAIRSLCELSSSLKTADYLNPIEFNDTMPIIDKDCANFQCFLR